MAKQKCETCRFFQEAGLAGSGWCHHPQRKTSSGVMVMVRRNELACRNAWSASLWEPASGAADAEQEPPRHAMALGPLPPANADDIRAVVLQDTVIADAGEDVLLSESSPLTGPVRPLLASHHAAPPHPGQGFDPRTALFRAHEAHRERMRAKDAAVRHSESIEPGRPSGDSDPGIGVSQQEAPPAFREEPGVDVSSTGGVSAERGAEMTLSSGDMSPAVYSQEDDAILGRWLEDAPSQLIETEPDHDELRLASLFEFADAPIPAWFRTDLPRTCRTCRDFRPSVEGDTGWCANRWAFNKAQGEPQQLVQEDEVVPCASPIGNWWAPVDDVWLVAADVSHHSRPTPLMDRYLPAKTAEKKRS
ncbi:MAG: hypothetical protein KC432_16655 [Thermomicrobiales bacterium]|nr:hypothetical protein [Thermomicrobiales bacterium]